MTRKDTRSYKNFHCWPTKKLAEIIDEPYNRGIDGHDYQPYIDEIKAEYYKRQLKKQLREEKNEYI